MRNADNIEAQLLVDYIPIVNDEWPSVHAAGYRSVSIQLGKVLDQFDELKAFNRNAGLAEIGSDDAIQIAKGTREVAAELSSLKATRFVASSISDGLRKLADEVDNPDDQGATADLERSEKAQASANYDALESTNNIFKELVLKAEEDGHVAAGHQAYKHAFADEYIDASARAGKADADSAAKAANRLMLAQSATGMVARNLAGQYPRMFGWLKEFIPTATSDGKTIEHDPAT